MHAAYIRPAGCIRTFRPSWSPTSTLLRPFLKVCDDIEDLLTDTHLQARNADIGVVSLDDAWRTASPA